MMALTIKKPWASLVISGGKDIENRDWPTKVRGTVAVHSSAKLDKNEIEGAIFMMLGFMSNFAEARFRASFRASLRASFRASQFPTGAILGTVEIADCVTASDSPWFCGEYGFVLRNAVAFKYPIPCRGALGFWNVPEELMPTVGEQYSMARKASHAL